VPFDWRGELPCLVNTLGLVRELHSEDAATLCASLTTPEMTRFTVRPPASVEGFARFITWARDQRASGQGACFAIVPRGAQTAAGLIQVRYSDAGVGIAEWGFAVAARYWGTGLFIAAARDVLAFTFDGLGVLRLEARSVTANGRAHGALTKLGAVREGILRQSFTLGDGRADQGLWALLRDEWRKATQTPGPVLH
jgi:RimJ/RimL family protein N-acetyltransferase